MEIYKTLKDKTIVKKVNDIFYEKIYSHPWISLYFQGIDQDHISQQQTDFIVGAIGGPKTFGGGLPSNAHTHMMITNDLFEVRKSLLIEALIEAGAPDQLKDAWLKIDEAFRSKIVKTSLSDCKGRWKTDPILDFNPPILYKKIG